MQSFRNRLGRLTCVACLCFALPVVVLAQTSKFTQLPPAAQQSIDKGLSAAQQQQWLAAIGYFEAARTAALASPIPLYNLGLAESKIPGRELRAISWFEAYLALGPNADNAPAVRQEISDHKILAKGNASKLIEILKQLAAKLPPSNSSAFPSIAGLLAKNGDAEAAEQIVQNQSDKQRQDYAREEIVKSLAKLKRIPDAIMQAEKITLSGTKDSAYRSIFSAQVAASLFSDAKKSIDQSSNQFDELLELVEAEFKSGKYDEATALLDDVRASIDKNKFDSWKNKHEVKAQELAAVAAAEYKIGRREEADALLQQVQKYASSITGEQKYGRRMYVLMNLAVSENEIGRKSKALGLLKEAEAACLAARNAHEEPVNSVVGDDWVLWHQFLYISKDYDGAKASLQRLFSYNPEIQHYREVELIAWRASSIEASANATCNAAKVSSIKTLANAASSPGQRAQAWSDYIKACLSAPLFTTELKATIAGLANFPPADNSSYEIFNHAKQPAEDLIDRINDIHELEQN
jgi:hypothetical protein